MTNVLLIAPDAALRDSMRAQLQASSYVVDAHSSFPLHTPSTMQIILCHAELAEGVNTLLGVNDCPVILFSNKSDIRKAVAAVREGAADYLVYPFLPDELVAAVERAMGSGYMNPHPGTGEAMVFYPMLGRCGLMLDLFARIQKVAPTESTVLIEGESGTGKELVARALHASSSRQQAPLISLNCAAIPETLIESELFGHERGAFTGATSTRSGLIESADNGTLFLDEIGELPIEAQARLLRVLQEGEIRRVGSTKTHKVNIRLIAATHRNLKALTKSGHFREDLYYRLNVVSLKLPPLRDRGSDVADLASYFLTKICKTLNRPLLTMSVTAIEAISNYNWPGNVRELENAIERAVILCDTDVIEAEALAIDHSIATTAAAVATISGTEVQAQADNEPHTSLEDYFVKFVMENQDQCTETELAHQLGISRKSLWERRQRLSIPRTKTKRKAPRRNP